MTGECLGHAAAGLNVKIGWCLQAAYAGRSLPCKQAAQPGHDCKHCQLNTMLSPIPTIAATCSGHQSFSNNKTLNDFVGNIVHSSILVSHCIRCTPPRGCIRKAVSGRRLAPSNQNKLCNCLTPTHSS